MFVAKSQRRGLQIVVTVDNITAAQIRAASDLWPEWISSECAANALGLPESHTRGGLPLYPPPHAMYNARDVIARIISTHGHEVVGKEIK